MRLTARAGALAFWQLGKLTDNKSLFAAQKRLGDRSVVGPCCFEAHARPLYLCRAFNRPRGRMWRRTLEGLSEESGSEFHAIDLSPAKDAVTSGTSQTVIDVASAALRFGEQRTTTKER